MIKSKKLKVVTLNKFLKGDYIKHLSNYCPRLLDNRWTEHETEQLFKVSLMSLNPLMIMKSLSFSKSSSNESVFRNQVFKAEDGDIFLLATDLMYKTDPELKAIAEVFLFVAVFVLYLCEQHSVSSIFGGYTWTHRTCLCICLPRTMCMMRQGS